mmetsp:Transcript_13545/g.22276  ORF Transcript_13545/g.22276 Transcript_13545/m.22276 type:complete len:220 (-) Transcript_13545:2084-2743(-)
MSICRPSCFVPPSSNDPSLSFFISSAFSTRPPCTPPLLLLSSMPSCFCAFPVSTKDCNVALRIRFTTLLLLPSAPPVLLVTKSPNLPLLVRTARPTFPLSLFRNWFGPGIPLFFLSVIITPAPGSTPPPPPPPPTPPTPTTPIPTATTTTPFHQIHQRPSPNIGPSPTVALPLPLPLPPPPPPTSPQYTTLKPPHAVASPLPPPPHVSTIIVHVTAIPK